MIICGDYFNDESITRIYSKNRQGEYNSYDLVVEQQNKLYMKYFNIPKEKIECYSMQLELIMSKKDAK